MSAELLARCGDESEPDGVLCAGTLRFHWGEVQAACDTCGGYCGIAVANWISVVVGPGGADPKETRE